MPENQEKLSWGKIFSISAVAFGIHVGGGFATGNQTVTFFVKYGWTAFPFVIIAMILLNLVFRSALINEQINHSNNYRQFADGAFAPAHKIMGPVFEIAFVIISIMAVSTSIAGGASLLETYGIPYMVGVIITGAIFFILVIFGKELIAKASTVMTVGIVVCMLLICIFGLTQDEAQLGQAMATSNNPNGLGMGAAIWAMLNYVGYQSYTGATLAPYAESLKNKHNVNRMVIMNFVLNTVMLGISTLLLMAWYHKVGTSTLPILEICTSTGVGGLRYAYSLVLYLAFISTGVGCTFGATTRLENLGFKNLDPIKRRAIWSLVVEVGAMALSMLGLTTLVAKGYGYLGKIGVFIMIIPCLTFVWYRNNKGNVTRPAALEENKRAE